MEQSTSPAGESVANMSGSKDLWTLSDGHAGNVRQSLALAGALRLQPRTWALRAHAPWRWWAPHCGPGADSAFGNAFEAALACPPRFAIGCGRQAALATRLLGRRGAKTVQILDPRIDPACWDLVIVPSHDGLRGDNVIQVLGSLHPVDESWLTHARTQFPAIGQLPRPRTSVLIGGPGTRVVFDRQALEALMIQLDRALARDGGSLLLTTSRRTPPALREMLYSHYHATQGLLYLGPDSTESGSDGGANNPYPGLLAWADRIVCTPDSVNMLSEACATDAPVFVFEPDRAHGRIRGFIDTLEQRGRIHALDGKLAPFVAEPLSEMAQVADQVRERLQL